MEVTGARAGIGADQLQTPLDVKADRGGVRMVHAAIWREKKTRRVAKRPRQRGRISVGLPVWLFPEQPDGLASEVHLAHYVIATLISDTLAGCRFRVHRNCPNKKKEQR